MTLSLPKIQELLKSFGIVISITFLLCGKHSIISTTAFPILNKFLVLTRGTNKSGDSFKNSLSSKSASFASEIDEKILFMDSSVDKWVKSKGGMIQKMTTSLNIDGFAPSTDREIYSSSNIDKGEVILTIPRSCILTKRRYEESSFGKLLKESGEVLSNEGSYLVVLLCDAIMKSKTETSDIYDNIITMLPTIQELQHMPLFWSIGDLEELEGSTLMAYLEARKLTIAADYKLLCSKSELFKESISENDFSWLYTATTSRIFSFHTATSLEVSLLVPIADMLNDNKSPELDWDWDEEKDMFTLTALKEIPINTALHISYGCIPNYARLFNYGFTLDPEITEDMSNSAELSSHQARLSLSLFSLSDMKLSALSTPSPSTTSVEATATTSSETNSYNFSPSPDLDDKTNSDYKFDFQVENQQPLLPSNFEDCVGTNQFLSESLSDEIRSFKRFSWTCEFLIRILSLHLLLYLFY